MSEQQQVANPFATAPVVARPGGDLAAVTGSAREIAEVQSAMVMARRFPRDEVVIVDRILQACSRPSLAEGALYEYARGGTDIRGPSIRLAECIAQYWGHIDFGWRVLEERPGVTKVQSFAWDMQTGTRSQIVFDVVHERQAGGSKKTLHDPRDIYEHIANAASRRLRACILRVVPSDVVEAALKQCEKTLVTKVEVTPERLQNLLAEFADYGVTKGAIEKRLQRRLEAITPGMMVQLGKIFTSLRDGMSQAGDWFDLGKPQEGPAASPGGPQSASEPVAGPSPSPRAQVRQRLQAKKEPEATPPPPEPQVTQEPVSEALRDVVRFAKAAASKEDVDRAAQIATHIVDEDEMVIAQEHLDSARERIG